MNILFEGKEWRLARIHLNSNIKTGGDIQLELKRVEGNHELTTWQTYGTKGLILTTKQARDLVNYALRKVRT